MESGLSGYGNHQGAIKKRGKMNRGHRSYNPFAGCNGWTNYENLTFNGWENYETELVKLWLDNDEGGCHDQKNLARKAISLYPLELNQIGLLADSLKNYVEERAPDMKSSLYADLLCSALEAVNWHEIARAILDVTKSLYQNRLVTSGSEADIKLGSTNGVGYDM